MYGSTRQFKVVGGDEELNEGIGDTPAFRGRLLIGFETTIIEGEIAGKSTVKREPLLRSSAVVSLATFGLCIVLPLSLKPFSHVRHELTVGRPILPAAEM